MQCNSQVPGHSIVNLTKQVRTIMDVYHTTTQRIINQQDVSTELATTPVKTVDNSNTAFTTLCTVFVCVQYYCAMVKYALFAQWH